MDAVGHATGNGTDQRSTVADLADGVLEWPVDEQRCHAVRHSPHRSGLNANFVDRRVVAENLLNCSQQRVERFVSNW